MTLKRRRSGNSSTRLHGEARSDQLTALHSGFGFALQRLIESFWGEVEALRLADSNEAVVAALMGLFSALGYEVGRVDGVARMHGVSREQTLALMSKCCAEGKRAALQQHQEASKGCTCDASRILMNELEFN